MTVLTVNINDKKDKEALKALKAIIEAFDLKYGVETDEDVVLSKAQQEEILKREAEYKSGKMELYSIEQVKAALNYKD